ncbi:MAG: nucleoside-diphosphate kinase [Eubacteriales bacterium]
MEQTLVLIKPDAIKRRLVGKILSYYEENHLEIKAIKLVNPSLPLLSKHYKEHADKSFYNDLIFFMLSGPSIAMILEGESAIFKVRNINGNTDPAEADMGTIRGDLGENKNKNLVHGSDSIESAEREIKIWFES